MKRIFFIMLAATLILTGCAKPGSINRIKADNIMVFYGFSSYAMFGADQPVIDDLLNHFNSLSFIKTTEKIDIGSAFIVNFYLNGNHIKGFSVDKNGVFSLDDENFKAPSGSFYYEYLKTIYEGTNNSRANSTTN